MLVIKKLEIAFEDLFGEVNRKMYRDIFLAGGADAANVVVSVPRSVIDKKHLAPNYSLEQDNVHLDMTVDLNKIIEVVTAEITEDLTEEDVVSMAVTKTMERQFKAMRELFVIH